MPTLTKSKKWKQKTTPTTTKKSQINTWNDSTSNGLWYNHNLVQRLPQSYTKCYSKDNSPTHICWILNRHYLCYWSLVMISKCIVWPLSVHACNAESFPNKYYLKVPSVTVFWWQGYFEIKILWNMV